MEIINSQTLTRTAVVEYDTFDSSRHLLDSTCGKPITLNIGNGDMHPRLEETILTMQPGEKRTVQLSAEETWGPHHPELIIETSLPTTSGAPGDFIQLTDGREGTIVQITSDTVTVDTNHPFAGKNLIIDITLISWINKTTDFKPKSSAGSCCGPAGCC